MAQFLQLSMSVRGGMLDASTLDGSMNRVIRLVMSV